MKIQKHFTLGEFIHELKQYDPATEVAFDFCGFIPDGIGGDTSYTRTDTIPDVAELQRQNAVLKKFFKRILMVDLDTCDVQYEAEKLGILIKSISSEGDVNTGNADEIGEDIFTFSDWMLDAATKMPIPSKAEVAREFMEVAFGKFGEYDGDNLISDGVLEQIAQEWEDAESK